MLVKSDSGDGLTYSNRSFLLSFESHTWRSGYCSREDSISRHGDGFDECQLVSF